MTPTLCHSTGVWTDADTGNVLVPAGQSWLGNDCNPDVNPTKIQGKLNHDQQATHKIGPAPVGRWRCGAWANYPRVGAMACPITQISGETFGRNAFFIHGPDERPEYYGQESEGCNVVMHNYRVNVLMPLLPEGTEFDITA